jgi:AraC-like DNA-binding protein
MNRRMGAITSLFVRKVVDTLSEGGERDAHLRSVGLDPLAPADVALMVSDAAYYDLLERLAETRPDASDLPVRVGARMRCDDYGAFGLAWKTAATLRHSFARAERYWRLLTSVAAYEVVSDGERAYFVLHRAGERRLGLRLSNEATLASVVAIVREVATAPFVPLEVHLRHRAPNSTAAHAAYFGCRLVFGSDRDALLVSPASLACPNRLADRGITDFLLAHLDTELRTVQSERSLRQEVQKAVATSLSGGVPSAASLARRLGMSERTLQRRLQTEGLAYRELVDHARRELAEGLLRRSDYPIAEVAFLTGFSEQSAFTRAFKRWTGATPAAYRTAVRPARRG